MDFGGMLVMVCFCVISYFVGIFSGAAQVMKNDEEHIKLVEEQVQQRRRMRKVAFREWKRKMEERA